MEKIYVIQTESYVTTKLTFNYVMRPEGIKRYVQCWKDKNKAKKYAAGMENWGVRETTIENILAEIKENNKEGYCTVEIVDK